MFYKRFFFSFYKELWIDAVDLGKEGQWMWFSSGRNVIITNLWNTVYCYLGILE